MNISQKLILQLIRYEFTSLPVDEDLISAIDEDVLESIYNISMEQEVFYIVADALSKLDLIQGDVKEVFFNEQLSGVCRHQLLEHELNSVSELFEQNSIEHIPLKGSVIRNLYPKPEMRPSCDIDILIHKDDLDKARELLSSKLSHRFERNGSHDVAFASDFGIELELHFRLYENASAKKDILDNVWDYALVEDGYNYRFRMMPEFFVFYHIFHMSKHFKNGGCGIRPFLDLFVIKNNFSYDNDKLYEFLKKSGLSVFSDTAYEIISIWFGTNSGNELVDLIEEYIFNAGIYGTFENMVSMSVAEKGGKIRSLLSKIFLPRELLKNQFPILEEKRWLTPYYEVKRWHRILFKDKSRVQFEIARQNANVSADKKEKAKRLIDELELS